jgi:hypothetical protein
MYCNAIYNSSATLSSHVRKEHMEERKLAALRDPVPVISDTTKKQPTQVAEEMCPEVRTLWRSVLPHDSDEEGSGR